MMKNADIEVLLASDSDYEELTAEIYCNGKFIALLNQDEGPENLIIEFPGTNVQEDMVLRTINLKCFRKSIGVGETKTKGGQLKFHNQWCLFGGLGQHRG